MEKLDADLAQFRKAFNERIMYVQDGPVTTSLIGPQIFSPTSRYL